MIQSEQSERVCSYLTGGTRNIHGPDWSALNELRKKVRRLLEQTAPDVWADLDALLDNPQRFGRVYAREGFLRTPSGVIGMYCWIDNRRGQEEEIWRFETIIDGREHTLRQVRTGRDRLTEMGAKRVAHRWIRDLRDQLGY